MSAVRSVALEALAEALEGIAFASATVVEEPFEWDDPALIWVVVPLLAPLSGRLVLAGNPSTLEALSADAWGGETPTGDAVVQFLAELTNVVAGVMLGRLHPEGEPGLGLPEPGAGALAPAAGGRQFTVDVDVGFLGVLIEDASA